MSESDDRSARVLHLAEEFLERQRGGEDPSIEEYVGRHPELADRIREIFPAMAMVEDVAVADVSLQSGGRATTPGASLMMTPTRLGDFRIIREVGRGGMGVVFEAEQISLGRHVALKVLPHQGAAGSVKLRRFLFEARAAARLHHSNIVPVFAVGEQDGVHYYAMQFIQGQGLDVIFAELRAQEEGSPTMTLSVAASVLTGSPVDRHEITTGSWPMARGATADAGVPGPAEAAGHEPAPDSAEEPATHPTAATLERTSYFRSVARVGRDVAEALAYAHSQGILHRDIKPSNLLLDAGGTVWITDFGLATGKGSDDLTATGDVVGTLRYMAPERFDGRSEPRSDVYSLGATLYELLTLQRIFDDSNRARLIKMVAHEGPVPPRRIDPSIPLDLETIVLKAIAKLPDHRYGSAAEMAADLRSFLEGRPILARRIGPVERVVRWSRRNPDLAASMAAVLLVLSFSSLGMALLWRRAESQRRRADELLVLSEKQRQEAETSRAEAERSRGEAEAHFTKARAAVDELLSRVSQSHLLNVPGLQPLRRDLLRSAMAYYEDFVRERANDPTLKAGLATAVLQLAIIQRELGAADQSKESLHRAMGLLESALHDRPDDPRLRAGMARCCTNLGVLGLDAVHPRLPADETLRLFERAVALWGELSRAEPANLDHATELANAYNLVAVLHANHKRMPESLRALQTSIALRERLAAAHPEDPAAQSNLASSLNNLGALVGDNTREGIDQLRIFRRAADHGRIAFARAPHVVKYGRFLSAFQRNAMVLQSSLGHFQEARASIGEALAVSRRLAWENPALPGLRSELAQDYRSLGDLLREHGRIAEAVRNYRASWVVAAPSAGRTRTTGLPWRACSASAPAGGRRRGLARRGGAGRLPSFRRRGDGGAPPRDRGGIQECRTAPGRRRIRRPPAPRRLPGRRGRGRFRCPRPAAAGRLRARAVPSAVAGVRPSRLRRSARSGRPIPGRTLRGRRAGRRPT